MSERDAPEDPAPPGSPALKMSTAELRAYLAEIFPQMGAAYVLEETGRCAARMRLTPNDAHLRPGGVVSGPTLFALADYVFYAAVLTMIGREPMAVTTNLSIDFMRAATMGDIIAEARILKLGRRLAVGDVLLFCEGRSEPVARASATYAIPQNRG